MVVISGWGRGGDLAAPLTREYATHRIGTTGTSALELRRYARLIDLLDNVSFRSPSGPRQPLTDAVVVGRIVSTSMGRAFDDGEDGGTVAEPSTEVPWDDPRSDWKTVHLIVEVDEVISGSAPGQIMVGLSLGAATDDRVVRAGLSRMGTLLLFLQHGRSPVFDYDRSVFADVEGGRLIALLDDRGRITLPMLQSDLAESLREGAHTLDELRAAATGPRREVLVNEFGEPGSL